jgi:acid phosphatase family membrane protein YuiD
MTFAPALRRFTLTTHVTSSVGWVGAVLVFLALAAIGLTSGDQRTVRGAYLVMAPAAWFVLVPLAHATLLSGLALSLGTPWGLFRHYWVVLKLAITVFATVILLIYMGTFRQMAGVAADPVVELGLVRNPSPLVHSILALILLVAATVLGIYKPFGMTPYGQRSAVGQRRAGPSVIPVTAEGSWWPYFFGALLLAIVALFVIMHLTGSMPSGHGHLP